MIKIKYIFVLFFVLLLTPSVANEPLTNKWKMIYTIKEIFSWMKEAGLKNLLRRDLGKHRWLLLGKK